MVSKELQSYYDSAPWQNVVRPTFLEEANYTCQLCGATDTVLQIHHFSYEHVFHELEYPESCICLCKNCHRLADRLRKLEKERRIFYENKRMAYT